MTVRIDDEIVAKAIYYIIETLKTNRLSIYPVYGMDKGSFFRAYLVELDLQNLGKVVKS